jgi:integrase
LDGAKLHVVEALEETRANGVAIKTPKTKAGRRTIGLPAAVVTVLREHRKAQLERRLLLALGRPPDDALVFPGDDDGYQTPTAFSMRWRRKAASIGMPEITWHSLRHAHASMLIQYRWSLPQVAARLGHARPDTTLRVYAHLYSTDDTEAVAALDQALGQ